MATVEQSIIALLLRPSFNNLLAALRVKAENKPHVCMVCIFQLAL